MLVFALLLVLPALIIAAPPANLEEDLFKLLDEDSDNKISEAEAVSYLLGFDGDKDGTINAQEFATNVDKVDPAFAGHEKALFDLLDKDANGKLDGKVNKSGLEAAFKLIDTDNNGQISRSEFGKAFADIITNIGG
ncbi:unnamed protein product [Candidula unifasciata]|uniref:EF-hand domain-containing protein n=1 Tax=Candidula unifasciata TaxID=100452 RepID=A0A8S3Z0E3_9EUPU|nr:unnamed protein product [Candidula unifasciata]